MYFGALAKKYELNPMYPIPKNEHLVEEKGCKKCTVIFPITDTDIAFYEKVSPIFGVKKYLIPPPTLCPDCREQRRLSFRNERKLYKRKCDATNRDIISIYSPDKPYTVYHQEYWWSDAWDPMSYGRNFDFSRWAFEQMGELMREVPRIAMMNDDEKTSENCAYCQDFAYGKNCYMTTSSWYIEDSAYSDQCNNETSYIFDSVNVNNNSSNIYYWIQCDNIQNCSYIQASKDSSYCHMSFDLIGCQECFGSYGLRNKKFHIYNKPYSEEDYKKMIPDLLSTWKSYEQFAERKKSFILPSLMIRDSESCSWDIIFRSFSTHLSYEVSDIRNCKYAYRGNTGCEDCYDIHQTWLTRLVYEWLTPDKSFHSAFVSWCWEWCSDLYYSDTCISCSNCTLCVWLRNKSYCILNKQYTREEYEKLVPRIIEKMISDQEWWEFFPSSLSPFGYNETVAQEYYPLSREEVVGNSPLRKGDVTEWQGDLVSEGAQSKIPPAPFIKGELFNWSDYEAPFPHVEKVIPASKLPDTIEGIPDDILNWAIECEISWKPFRIIRQELAFYRKHSLPIPKRHPDVRHMDRMKMRNPRKLFEKKCDKCKKDMITTYAPYEMKWSMEVPLECAPERTETVYCEECYNREIVG